MFIFQMLVKLCNMYILILVEAEKKAYNKEDGGLEPPSENCMHVFLM